MQDIKEIIIQKASISEIDWVNARYKEVGFVSSNFDEEHIALAKISTIKCGLGRLTKIDQNNLELGGMYVFDAYRGLGVAEKIVTYLLDHAGSKKKVWCLPFAHLLHFYAKFGFKDHTTTNHQIPDKIASKLHWCTTTYKDEVLLLVNN